MQLQTTTTTSHNFVESFQGLHTSSHHPNLVSLPSFKVDPAYGFPGMNSGMSTKRQKSECATCSSFMTPGDEVDSAAPLSLSGEYNASSDVVGLMDTMTCFYKEVNALR